MKFACPGCGQHIECREEHAGKKALCPTCKQPFIIPGVPSAAPTRRTPPKVSTARKTPSTAKAPLGQPAVMALILTGTATVAILAAVLCLHYIRPPAGDTGTGKPTVTPLAPPPVESAAGNPAGTSPAAAPAVEAPSLPPTARVDTKVIPAPAAPLPTAKTTPVHSHPLRDPAPHISFTPNYDGSQSASIAKIENGLAAVEDQWLEAGKVETAHSKGNEIWCFEIIAGDSGAVTSKEINVAPQQFVLVDLEDVSYRGDMCREQQGGELRRGEKLRINVCFEMPAKSTPRQLVWNPPIVFASTRQPAQCNSQWLAKKEIFRLPTTDHPAGP